jgi:hypothetical protein
LNQLKQEISTWKFYLQEIAEEFFKFNQRMLVLWKLFFLH